MSVAVQQLLDAFDELAEADKHQTVVEILRRTARAAAGDLPEETLVVAADALFLALDAEEASHAPR